jgi:flavin-dependent thymidylate synthase
VPDYNDDITRNGAMYSTWSRGTIGGKRGEDGRPENGKPEFDDNPLLRDVAFNKHSRNFGPNGANIVSPSAQAENHVGLDGIQVRLIQGLPSEREVARIIWKGRAATRGLAIGPDVDAQMDAEIGDDPETWREMFKGGLQTALEAFVLVFEVSGVSRTGTHQIVRSRRAGFHQQSQRAGSYVSENGTGPNVRTPESVWRKMDHDSELGFAWRNALYWSRKAYRLACENDVSYQDARFILPEGTENYIMCEYTLREFLAVYAYRACSMFQWEICHIVREMGRVLREQSPWIVGTGADPKISCEKTEPAVVVTQFGPSKVLDSSTESYDHQCTFQGWERVEGQCGFAWAREENRQFRPHKSI